MLALKTRIDPKTVSYRDNRQRNLARIEQLEQHLARARAGGGPRYVERHQKRGKLLPRERIDLLLDRDSPFLELLALAGMHEPKRVPGAGGIAGIGWINRVECMVSASEATVQGGAVSPPGLKKWERVHEIAWENRLPLVHCMESAGAELPTQVELFVPGGAAFRHLAQRSEAGLPTISLVFGSCTAGGAYIPGMSDYVVMVRHAAYMYLAGPPLVRMATGEVVDDEALGGAEMHSQRSGVADYLAQDERDCIRIGRELVGRLGWRKLGDMPRPSVEPPRYSADELLGIVSADLNQPFESREVIARLVDGSRFSEFKPRYGSTLVCGYAELAGYRVGIIANNGVLFADSAEKGAQFIMLCNQSATPLLFLQNTTGFMVGRAAEEGGIIRAGAKMINAVSNSTVPAITLMIGGSFGAGNYAMMGRAYRPRFLFSWPMHRLAVMGPEQLAGVLELVRRQAAARQGVELDESQLQRAREALRQQVEAEASCWSATGRMFDDGVIDPRHTREVLALALSAIHCAPVTGTQSWGVFRH